MQREDQTDHGNGPGTNSSESAVNHLSKSVVRESRTPRSVGTGGGRPLPVTRSGRQRCRSRPRHRGVVLGSALPALKGRRFETWAQIEQAVERATAYWNEHKHPFIWGRRRRHRTPRRLGLAAIPTVLMT